MRADTWSVLFAFGLMLAFPATAMAQEEIVFTDVTKTLGLAKPLEDWRYGHGAAWGDVDGDGRPDFYMGAFADRDLYKKSENPPIANPLFLNRPDAFVLSEETSVRLDGKYARTSMALFVDLDNDGDLDLVAGAMAGGKDQSPNTLFENLGQGKFRDVTPAEPPWPSHWNVRNITAMDFDGDGLLDLVFTDGSYGHWRVDKAKLLVLRNRGKWEFEDVSAKYGFPEEGSSGLGMAVGDVNNDGVFDIFVGESCRLFVSGPDGRYRAYAGGGFPKGRGESRPCGAALGDVNGDDLLDLVITLHGEPGVVWVYLNKGLKDGMPTFANVATVRFPRRSLVGMGLKTTQVGLCDVDNDGRKDILLSVTWVNDAGNVQPLVLRNEGNNEGVPRFHVPPLKMCVGYYATGPIADYDRDGRMDILLPSWFERIPCYLFRNTSKAGHWLTVRVAGDGKRLNPMGIGATVRAYKAGSAGRKEHLIARHDISVGNGYASGEEALAHLGLGEARTCDVQVTWGKQRVTRKNVAADQMIKIDMPGGN